FQKQQAVSPSFGPVLYERVVAGRAGVSALAPGVNPPCFGTVTGLHHHAPRRPMALLLGVDALLTPPRLESGNSQRPESQQMRNGNRTMPTPRDPFSPILPL